MRILIILLALGLTIGGLVSGASAQAGKAFLWNGTHWQQVSEDGKIGYIFGIGNLADFEMKAAGGKKPACISRAFVDDLKARTVQQIVQEVDKFYRENPSKQDTSVIEVILQRCTKSCPGEVPKK